MEKIKILVVDDHKIVRSGLIELLNKRENHQVVGEAENGREALEKIKKCRPDIVFLDISMPEMNGIEAIDQIRKSVPSCRIVILTMYDNNKYVAYALSHGISGYLLKDINAEELFIAIDRVMAGDVYLCEKINRKVIRDFASLTRDSTFSTPLDALSAREQEVFQLIAEGNTGKEIAGKLNISPKTVEHHRYKIMEKLQCSNIAQIVRLALKEGIITP
ncbi:TRAP-type C4-dicarboxylate transporter, periplasmic solute-binding protein [Candidatus Zixiibacteriota bacterium]|nr:TRAP-type C4-dicarboxylate transporter, periplasmic solute-binding protein [candidate division Zixibacteria bacterium]